MTKFLIMVFLSGAMSSYAQGPLVKLWDYRFGGTQAEWLTCIQKTKDGGIMLGGYSTSNADGNKTQNWWAPGWDYWIVKLDSLGQKQWDKRFGGIRTEVLTSFDETLDGGYILGGYSYSNAGGDKSQPIWGTLGWDCDYWVVKIDSLGNKQWDKDFGGTADEDLNSVKQTRDGGYILGGWSYSPVSGNKTAPPLANGTDYWIVKIDSLGNKLWDKVYGSLGADDLHALYQTSDGGYILGGRSASGIGGDKTQPSYGGYDFWIVKIDSLGIVQWDKDFGGDDYDEFNAMAPTSDNGFILGGLSYSGITGNKSEPLWGTVGSDYDFWVIKIDSLGNKEWDKDYGGTDTEIQIGNISQTSDGGYLIGGATHSNISGDKTEMNLSPSQSWVIKTDSLGTIQWDKTLHTNTAYSDLNGFAIEINDGCFAMANYTGGGIAGDKTQPCWDSVSGYFEDYWIVKFCPAPPLLAGFTSNTGLCPGACTNFINLSSSATSYQWIFYGANPGTSTSINPQNICYANPGSYNVTLIATNGASSDTLTLTNYITVYPFPQPQGILQGDDTLFANAGASSYQWYFNGNMINGATDYFYVAPASGDYNVVATDANGCEVEAAIFNVVAGMLSTVDSGQLTIFPNPVEDKVKIHPDSYRELKVTSGTAIEIAIYNMLGENIYTAHETLREAVNGEQIIVNCEHYSSGMYYLEMTTGSKIFRTKFVKQ